MKEVFAQVLFYLYVIFFNQGMFIFLLSVIGILTLRRVLLENIDYVNFYPLKTVKASFCYIGYAFLNINKPRMTFREWKKQNGYSDT